MLQPGPRLTQQLPEAIPLWQSLRGRLMTILFVALAPVLVLSVLTTLSRIRAEGAEEKRELEREATVLSGEYASFFDRSFQVLSLLSRQPEVTGPALERCPATLGEARAAFSDFTNIALAGPDGMIRCSATDTGALSNVAGMDWFKRANASKKPVVGGMTMPVSRETVLVAAIPIGLGSAYSGGVLFVSIGQSYLARLHDVAMIPRATELYLLAADGRPLLGRNLLAAPLPSRDTLSEALARAGQVHEKEGRMYVASPLHGGEVVGLLARAPEPFRLARLLALLSQIALPVVLTAAALVIVWVTAERIIVRWIRHLRAVAISYRRGNMNVRTRDIEKAPRELAQLGHTLDQMADAIVDREARLVETLKQREELLREIHHRVKNNLQIITSLINLQLRSVTSEQERMMVRDIQARVDALALVYRSAYGSQQLALIDLRELLPALVDQTARYFHGEHPEVDVATACEEVYLPIDDAIPFAQLVTEGVVNAIRHAFPPQTPGKVSVEVSRVDDEMARLSVRDDGVGLPPDLAKRPMHQRTGHALIIAFAKQMGGSAEFKSDGGTEVIALFPYRQDQGGVEFDDVLIAELTEARSSVH